MCTTTLRIDNLRHAVADRTSYEQARHAAHEADETADRGAQDIRGPQFDPCLSG